MKRGFSHNHLTAIVIITNVSQNRGPDEEGIFTRGQRRTKANYLTGQNRGPDEEGIFTELRSAALPGACWKCQNRGPDEEGIFT